LVFHEISPVLQNKKAGETKIPAGNRFPCGFEVLRSSRLKDADTVSGWTPRSAWRPLHLEQVRLCDYSSTSNAK